MNQQQKTIFISDLHLSESTPAITQRLFSLLKNSIPTTDAVYILGDLFDVWIGDDDTSPYQQQIIQTLKSFTARGLPIYLLHGNRDFLIGKCFLHETGIELLADETVITLYGSRVLLMHGDILCTQDVAYLRARKVARN